MAGSLQFAFGPADVLQQRLDAVLRDGAGPWPLTPEARKMLGLLVHHKGARAAIKGAEIASWLKVGEREVKALAKSLVEDYGIPLGASRVHPFGYYLIETADELENAISIYTDEMRSLARRVRALGGPQRTAELFGQIQLALTGEAEAPAIADGRIGEGKAARRGALPTNDNKDIA
jgi:hypothetical protein